MGWHRVMLFAGLVAATAALFVILASGDPDGYLVFATWGTPAEVESFQRLIRHYNATRSPEFPVKLSHIEQGSYTEHLLVQAAARSLPDVIHLDRKDLPMFVHRGLLENLSPIMQEDTAFSLDVFVPALLSGCQVAGSFYGVPHNFSTLVLYYNRDHFDAEGLVYPDSSWTWEDLLQAARRLTKKDRRGNTLRYGCMVQIVRFTLIQQFGGRILDEGIDSCVIASPEAAAALQFDTDLAEKYGVTWNVLSQNLNWDDMFAGGRCSMIANGRWAAAWYLRSMPADALDVAPLPRGKVRAGASVNHMMTISAESDKKGEAWEFIRFLVSETGQRMVNEDGANIPALRSLATTDEFLRHPATPAMNNMVFLDELPHSVVWPCVQGPYLTGYALHSQLDLAMRRIQLDGMTPARSLAIMQANLNRTIAAQRSEPEPSEFTGSVLFYVCCAVPAAALLLWRRKSRRGISRNSRNTF